MHRIRDDRGGRTVAEHELEAIERIRLVERHVGAACLQDGQQPDERVRRARQQQRNHRTTANAGRAQGQRQERRTPVEFPVGDGGATVADRHCIRKPCGDGGKD